jgi:ketosteroid isomerase-like protein
MAIERAPELERLSQQMFEAYTAGDIEAIEQAMSRDDAVVMIGTDPDEVWEGHDATIASLRQEVDSLREDTGFESIHVEDRAYCEGDVGWVITKGKFRLADGAEIPTRGLSIAHREDGDWKFVTGMYSIAVPNTALEAGSPLAQALTGATR